MGSLNPSATSGTGGFAWRHRASLIWAVGAFIAVLVTALLQSAPTGVLRQWEQRFTDVAWRVLAQPSPERRVVLIDIDDRSIAEVGAWPWSRETQARLMDALAVQQVRQQVWDVVFAGPGNSAAGNETLGRAIQAHRPVMAQVLGLESQVEGLGHHPLEGRLAGQLSWPNCPEPFQSAQAYLANHSSVMGPATPGPQANQSAAGPVAGHITPRLAQDGVLRHQPAVVCFEGRAYPALALVAMGQAMGSQQWELQRGGGLLQPAWTLTLWPEASINRTSPGTGGSTGALLRVPLEANGDLALAWQRQPEAWFSLSAADVLAGRVPKGMLSGAWVVVGGSAFGLNDRIATPLQSAAAGFVAHAQLLANLLDGAVPQRPHSQTFLEAGLALLVFGLLSLAAIWSTKGRRSSPAHAAATSPSSVAAIPAWLIPASLLLPLLFIGLHFALLRQGVLVGWIAPASGVALAGFVLGAWAQARSRLERERLYSHLSSYLPARVAQVLVGRSPSDRIDARAEEAVVLFADIRNFSAYCETRPPAEAAAVLHAFYTTAQHTVQAHGGTLEALQGDSIIAVWAVEDTRASQSAASAAIAAAVQMLRSVAGALPDPAPAGLEPLALGIGIECGPCMSGSIGPADRRTHLVMGRTVTVAGRLVEMTAELAHPILLGEGMAARLSGTLGTRSLRSLGTFMLEGLRVPHHIYAWLEEGAGLPSRGGLHAGGQPSVAATAPDRPPVASIPEGPPASPLH